MTDKASEQASNDAKLDLVLAEYIRRRDAGEAVDVEVFCTSHPDLADALRSYAAGENLLQGMVAVSDASQIDSAPGQAMETLRPGAARSSDLSPNTPFGRYRIVRMLGQGAMGAIYLAEDANLDRQVALKIPKFSGPEGEEYRERFAREARAAARLDHPNICRVYDAAEHNGTPFITMAYIDGQPLSRYVGTDAYKDQRRIADVVRGIAAGLQHAHEHGILHRDLKPGNVLVPANGIPCVTDFGLARRVDAGDESRLTHEGTILGTPAYMSPEQIEGKSEAIGPKADIYSLGVLLYELLTERLPFQGSVMAILGKALRDRPAPLSQFRSDVDPQLADLCLQMLDKSPEKRPASMQQVENELNLWLSKSAPNGIGRKPGRPADRLHEMKSRIESRIQGGQFAAAVAGLEKIVGLRTPDAAEYVAWAGQKLPEVRKLRDDIRRGVPDLVATARELIRQHDYAEGVRLLQEIPAGLRNDDVERLLTTALERQEESELLLADLKECVRTEQFDGIEDNLQRLLKLKPGNRFAKRLWESLQTYSRIPAGQRKYRTDDRGRLQPLHEDNFLKGWVLWSIVVGVLVFGLATWSIMSYLNSGDGPGAPSTTAGNLLLNGDAVAEADLSENWIELFNGRDVSDWTIRGTRDWTVKNGELACVGNNSKLVSELGEWTDFELQLECRLAPGTNSGIFLRTGNNADHRDGYEVQLGSIQEYGTGSLFDRAPFPTKVVDHSTWFPVTARVRGNRITVTVDGRRTVDYIDGQNEFLTGHVALQGHKGSGEVRFRNIRIRELAAEVEAVADVGWVDLINGTSLTGWKAANSPGNWQVVADPSGDVLTGNGQRDNIFTTQQYENFELELEYRLQPGGNSGIWLRTPNDSDYGFNNAREAMAISLLDDASPNWAKYIQTSSQRTGGLYGITGPESTVVAEANRWHQVRVSLNGTNLVLVINGRQMLNVRLDDEMATHPEYKGLGRTRGYIGLEDHGTGRVEFREIRIRKL